MSIGNEVTISCYDQEIRMRSTMKNILDKLDCNDLVQITKAIAINFNHIDDLGKWYVRCSLGEIQIGRKFQKQFIEKYEEFLLR